MMASALYRCQVMHRRTTPRAYRFRYRLFSLLLDVDELDGLSRQLRFFSRNRFNLVSFHDRDFGPRDGSSLRAWAETLLTQAGIHIEGGPIRIFCFPRVLGYGFSPLSVWYCHHRNGRMAAAILEVRNTFGEKHQYLLPVGEDGCLGGLHHWEADKAFHVSPFIGPEARYRFRLQAPGEHILVRVEERWSQENGVDPGPQMLATWSGRRRGLSDACLLRAALALPPMGLRIMALIHWHALKLWLKGVPFHHKPRPPAKEVTAACPHDHPSR